MALTINLEPESETRLRDEASRLGLPVEELTAQLLLEADLLWRIRTAAPEPETRELHRLIRKRKARALTEGEQTRLQTLLDAREERGAQRLHDLGQLSRLRSIPIRQLMEQLGIHPLATP
jgi:hypothetical protein